MDSGSNKHRFRLIAQVLSEISECHLAREVSLRGLRVSAGIHF